MTMQSLISLQEFSCKFFYDRHCHFGKNSNTVLLCSFFQLAQRFNHTVHFQFLCRSICSSWLCRTMRYGRYFQVAGNFGSTTVVKKRREGGSHAHYFDVTNVCSWLKFFFLCTPLPSVKLCASEGKINTNTSPLSWYASTVLYFLSQCVVTILLVIVLHRLALSLPSHWSFAYISVSQFAAHAQECMQIVGLPHAVLSIFCYRCFCNVWRTGLDVHISCGYFCIES